MKRVINFQKREKLKPWLPACLIGTIAAGIHPVIFAVAILRVVVR
jgi:hypothetical protein